MKVNNLTVNMGGHLYNENGIHKNYLTIKIRKYKHLK